MVVSILAGVLLSQGNSNVIDELRAEAKGLQGYAQTALGKELLAAVDRLPDPGTRAVYQDPKSRTYYDEDSAGRKKVELDSSFYYYTKYGSPLAYLRAVDLLGQAGLKSFRGKKSCDFGYGGIGPLLLIALNGGRATGVDVDSILKALYSKAEDTVGGRIKLVEGYFPTDPKVVKEVGGGYDVFMSKNTLKRGYIHPERAADKRFLIDLGVSDLDYCKAVAKLLKKGGLFLIYNLCPAQNPPDKPFLPMSDGRSPFAREAFEAAGFSVIAIDQVDGAQMRDLGHRLGWDKGENPMDFEKDLFAWYTLVRKR